MKRRCARVAAPIAALMGALACRPTQSPSASLTEQAALQRAGSAREIEGALRFGVESASVKIRPQDPPPARRGARLLAARNEFEAFQLVLRAAGGPVRGISLRLARPLRGAGGQAVIAADKVALYRVGLYSVGQPSNAEGAAGSWPDPLIPHIDPYARERRNAFPLDIPAGETRSVWVEIFVPPDAEPGTYAGELSLFQRAELVATIPMSLEVGRFTLPSTPTLKTAFGMGFSQPCLAHTNTESCSTSWDERAACLLRERYVRAALDHRVTIAGLTFQPPFGDSAAPFEAALLPLARGRGQTRLAGARTTTIGINAESSALARWLRYGAQVGIAEQMFWLAADEPQESASEWERVKAAAQQLRQSSREGAVMVLASIDQANRFDAARFIDIFAPALSALDYHGDVPFDERRHGYDTWLAGAKHKREVWAYLSCMARGCQGEASARLDREQVGWPSRLIDASAVQNRAFGWLAFIQRLSGEVYYDVAQRLSTAWRPGGQDGESGAGAGTLFYPGTPALIGGKTHVPVESIRLKLIRDGIEDYEYLRIAAERDPEGARAIALELFPRAFECAQPAAKLERARARLFALAGAP